MRAMVVAYLAVAFGAAGCGADDAPSPARAPAPSGPTATHRVATRAPAVPADPSLPRDIAVPILMYHVINSPPAGTPFPELWVPADRFAAEMQALARAGYHGVTLTQVDDHWRRGAPLPAKPIVVSFDDGYLSQYRSAAPVLRSLRWPGVLFLEVSNLHTEGGLSPRMVRSLLADGWELGAHSISHADLTKVGPEALQREVAGSREELRRQFGVPVNFFCYPAGRYDAAAVAAVQAAGFRGATTVDPGLARTAERFTLKRLRVNGHDTPDGVLATVEQR